MQTDTIDPTHRLIVAAGGLADATAVEVEHALAEGRRPIVIHAGAMIGAAIEVACEARGLSRPDFALVHLAAGSAALHQAATGAASQGPTHLVLTCPEAWCQDFGDTDAPRSCLVSLTDGTAAADVVTAVRSHDALEHQDLHIDLRPISGELLALELLGDAAPGGADALFGAAAAMGYPANLLDRITRRHTEHSSRAHLLTSVNERLAQAEARHRQLHAKNELITTIDARLREADGDLGRMLTLAATGSGRSLVLEDSAFRLLRWSREPRPAPPSLSELWSPRRATELARRLETGEPALVRLGIPSAGHRLVMRVGHERALGYLSMCDVSQRDAHLDVWLRELATLVAVAMVYEEETTRVASTLRAQVVQMLLLGHLGPQDAASAARRVGWHPGTKRATIAVAVREDGPNAGQRTQRRHLAAVLREADRIDLPAAMIDGTLLLVAESVDDVATLLRGADMRGDAVALGVGTLTTDPARIARSHREALWAARTAIDEGVPLVDFADTGLHRLFLPGHEAGDPEFERPIAHLEANAEQCSFDPIDTLTAYLDAGGNASRAATELHLHLNSLRYRLQRISEITAVDLADPEVRFQLQLALRLRRTRRALHDAVPETFR